jgi:hypothetical protein
VVRRKVYRTTNGLTRHLLGGFGLSSRVLRVGGSSGYLADVRRPLGRAGGTEEVNEQLCDALSLVVMDPMRRLGQALDAVEVGHIVVVGLG